MPDPLNTRIAEITDRAEAAQIGPWKFHSTGYDDRGYEIWSLGNADDPIKHPVADFATLGEPATEDRAFIAHAREDVPFLLAALQTVREALRGAADRPCVYGTDHGGCLCYSCVARAALAPEQTEGYPPKEPTDIVAEGILNSWLEEPSA